MNVANAFMAEIERQGLNQQHQHWSNGNLLDKFTVIQKKFEKNIKTPAAPVELPTSIKSDDKPTAIVLSISVVLVLMAILAAAAALIIYTNKRKRNWVHLGDTESGKLLLHHHPHSHRLHRMHQRLETEPRRCSEPRRPSHGIDFTIPKVAGHFSPLESSRRVLSTPDLTQCDDGSSDGTPTHYAGQYTIPQLHRQYDNSNSFKRNSLGALDPELYKSGDSDEDIDYPEGHIGRVWFTLQYQKELERLIVTIIKIKNLPSRVGGSTHGCDPIIKLCLLPDERRYLQSSQKRRTCNPRIDEAFYFQVSGKSIDERILQITIFDVDSKKKFRLIGYVMYKLKDFDTTSEDKLYLTRDFSKKLMETPSSGNGEILLSLCFYDNIGRLTVSVFEAKGLPETADTYAKVSFLQRNKVLKTKKTSIIKQSSDPKFNELHSFKSSNLETASVVVHLYQVATNGSKDLLVGRVAFGSYMFAKGRALEHWNDMLSNSREQIRKWHYLQP
ncbi:synaptotagmin XV [Chamberlinius hualienensis]